MADVKHKNVFLCGPMTGIFAYNVSEFAWVHKRLLDAGAERVFDPAYEWYTSIANGHERDAYDECMRRTIGELVSGKDNSKAFYDMVVALPGWEHSDVASTEVSVAKACGIPVHQLVEVIDVYE